MKKENVFLNNLLARINQADNDLEDYSFGDDYETGDIYDDLTCDLSDMINQRLKQLKSGGK